MSKNRASVLFFFFFFLGFTVNYGVEIHINSKHFCTQWVKLKSCKRMLTSVGLGEKCDLEWYSVI